MTHRSRRELEQAIDDLETSTPAGGEYDDPPELSREQKHDLAELFDTGVWDRDTEGSDAVEDVAERYGGST